MIDTNNAQYLLLLLDALLLELRNLESSELVFAPKLAYIFHNIPTLLLYAPTPEECASAIDVMQGRANALGLHEWMRVVESNAHRNLKDYDQ